MLRGISTLLLLSFPSRAWRSLTIQSLGKPFAAAGYIHRPTAALSTSLNRWGQSWSWNLLICAALEKCILLLQRKLFWNAKTSFFLSILLSLALSLHRINAAVVFLSPRCRTIRPSRLSMSATGRMGFLSVEAFWPNQSSMVRSSLLVRGSTHCTCQTHLSPPGRWKINTSISTFEILPQYFFPR